jgi:putative flippase GtrA
VWLVGIIAARALSVFIPALYQFAKFVMVGFLNTAIDFGILNLFSFATGLTAGFVIGGVNIPGFLTASFNSYLWNKFWVFDASENHYGDIALFALAVGIGVLLNSVVVVVITTYISPLTGFSVHAWLNVAKAFATGVTLFWHFFAFKFLVFRAVSHHYDA